MLLNLGKRGKIAVTNSLQESFIGKFLADKISKSLKVIPLPSSAYAFGINERKAKIAAFIKTKIPAE